MLMEQGFFFFFLQNSTHTPKKLENGHVFQAKYNVYSVQSDNLDYGHFCSEFETIMYCDVN